MWYTWGREKNCKQGFQSANLKVRPMHRWAGNIEMDPKGVGC